MSVTVLTVGPGHSLQDAARFMDERGVGAAVVMDPDAQGPGIITERDILHVIAAGGDPSAETVGDHMSEGSIFAAPDWGLEQAAEAMTDAHFRHLIVVDGSDLVGILSMRDIVACSILKHQPIA